MNMLESRCQCLQTCSKPPSNTDKTSPFCDEHRNFCPRVAPLSKSEPKYDPDFWNLNAAIRLAHNCYSYAFNVIDPNQIKACESTKDCDTPFHQPGSPSKYPKFNEKDPKTCPNMIARLMGDHGIRITPSAFELKCPRGSSKIALIVDEDQDYHFLVQNAPIGSESHGLFSQKSGAMPVTNLDARGRKIFDVLLANHNFNKNKHYVLNYDKFCGYFCVDRVHPLFMKTGGGLQGKGKGKGR